MTRHRVSRSTVVLTIVFCGATGAYIQLRPEPIVPAARAGRVPATYVPSSPTTVRSSPTTTGRPTTTARPTTTGAPAPLTTTTTAAGTTGAHGTAGSPATTTTTTTP